MWAPMGQVLKGVFFLGGRDRSQAYDNTGGGTSAVTSPEREEGGPED